MVSENLPHIKRGVLRDFENIMGEDFYKFGEWNKTDKVYRFKNGSVIEFFGADDFSKLKGSRRDILFINECNNIPYESYKHLSIRTRQYTILDWNPDSKFWFHNKLMDQPGVWFDISTHKDNDYLDQKIRNAIEAARLTDPEWYRVYGLGLVGQHEAIVFRNWKVQDLSEIYKKADRINYGLDFGYWPDPAAFVVTAKIDKKIYIFKTLGMNEGTNEQLAQLIQPWCGGSVVWCDSATPKDVKELQGYGINAKGVGKKDRDFSIKWLAGHEIIIDPDCVHLIEEFEDFSRVKDKKTGEILPVFQDKNDHWIDALRYAYKVEMMGCAGVKHLHITGI